MFAWSGPGESPLGVDSLLWQEGWEREMMRPAWSDPILHRRSRTFSVDGCFGLRHKPAIMQQSQERAFLHRFQTGQLALALLVLGLAYGLTPIHAVPAVDVTKLPPPASKSVDFAKDIQPIFAENCYGCHG